MVGGAIAGRGIVKLLALLLREVSAVSVAAGAEAAGGGAARLGAGGSVESGVSGGACAVSVETAASPLDWKSGGSTYLLKSTLPPNRRMMSRWIRAETVRNREARIGRRNRSKWDCGLSGIASGWGERERLRGPEAHGLHNLDAKRESVEQK